MGHLKWLIIIDIKTKAYFFAAKATIPYGPYETIILFEDNDYDELPSVDTYFSGSLKI